MTMLKKSLVGST